MNIEDTGEHDHFEEEYKETVDNGAKTKNGVKSMNGDAEPLLKTLRKPSDLQIKLEEQLEKSRKANGHSKMISRGRMYPAASSSSSFPYPRRLLMVPGKGGFTDMRPDEPPLVSVSPISNGYFEDVALGTPNDEMVIFKQPSSPYKGPRDCTQQLLKDGYRLDELSDDEDLDLILPNRTQANWCSCENVCTIQ
eukprot:gene9591-10578_t